MRRLYTHIGICQAEDPSSDWRDGTEEQAVGAPFAVAPASLERRSGRA